MEIWYYKGISYLVKGWLVMNIGLFTDTYAPQVSGVVTSIQTLRQQLIARGHRVYIFTSTDPNVPRDVLEPDVYRFPSLPFIGFKDRRLSYRGGIQAIQLAKKLQLDIVHTQTEFSLGLIGKLVARQLKIPAVHTFHTNYEDYLHYVANGKIIRPASVAVIARSFMAGMTGVIAPSKQTYDTLTKYKVSAPIEIIPTGVNVKHAESEDTSSQLRQKLGISSETPVVLSLGRIAFEKNIDTALEIFAEVLMKVPDAIFLIVGGGPAMAALKDHVRSLEISDNVIFTGEVDHDEVYGYYKLADVFLSASISETQGLTFIEAMTANTPVVAIRSPYLETVVIDDNIGALADDSYELLEPVVNYLMAKKTHRIIGQPSIREKVLYDIDAVTFGQRVLDCYSEALVVYHEEEDMEEATSNDLEYAKSFLTKTPFHKEGK